MKKLLLVIVIISSSMVLFGEGKFFIHNRYGALIKVDLESATVLKYPKKKGPAPMEVPRKIEQVKFENEILAMVDAAEKEILTKYYHYDETVYGYTLTIDTDSKKEFEAVRNIFMKYNKDNEIPTGLSEYGIPMPHNFPRVFEAKSKAHFDIHFAWGVKIENGNYPVTVGFSVNLTNFVMPSLEIMAKVNFIIEDYPFEPYVGGVLYGGFLDGFPIGLSAIGGCDFFPLYFENRDDNKNFYLSGELRIGTVLYAPIYFDTGLNSEGIWKKFSWLGEGGFYFGVGHIWY